MQFVSTHHHLSPGDTIACRSQVSRPGVPCLDVGTLSVCPASEDQVYEILRALMRWLYDREAVEAVAIGTASRVADLDLVDMFDRLWEEVNGGPSDA